MRFSLILFCVLVSWAQSQTSRQKIAVYKFTSDELTKSQATELAKFVTDEVRKYPGYDVLDWANVGQVLGFVEDQSALGEIAKSGTKAGCTSDRCYTELGNRLGVDFMIVGSANKIGNRYLVNLSLQDVEKVAVIGTAKAQIRGNIGDILDSLPSMVAKILNKPMTIKETILTEPLKASSSIPTNVSQSTHSKVAPWLRFGGLGLAAIGGGLAYYFDQKAKDSYDKYSSAQDVDQIQNYWSQIGQNQSNRTISLVVSGVGVLGLSTSFFF